MLFKKLSEKLGDPEKFLIPCNFLGIDLADRSITHPKGVDKDVFVKVGKFYFPTDFVVVDFEADLRVPIILGRSFLRTDRALIDVYGEEITLRYTPNSSNPTLVSDPLISESDCCKEPIVKSSSPTFTPFGERDVLFLEKLLNEDPFQHSLMDLKPAEETKEKSSIEEPIELELKELPSHLEEEIVLGHKISKSRIEVDRAKVDVIAKVPHSTTVKGVRSFLGHAGFCRRFIQDFSKIARPMTHLLEKETPFVFSKEYQIIHHFVHEQEAFDILMACHEGPTGGHHGANLTAKKGIDFMEPFSSSKGNKYILVAVDYLSKWVEVKALPTYDARVVVKFLKSLFSRFGIPRAIISDSGTHFCNDQFTRVMIKYGVTQRLSTAYHPQTSGQVEAQENKVGWYDFGVKWADGLVLEM
nr:reverse transcriptase domain-containing protein [Tanacetum cinerariifolium]